MDAFEEFEKSTRDREHERWCHYKSVIDSRRSNRITFYADDECKAEILELLREDHHNYKIVDVSGYQITIEILE